MPSVVLPSSPGLPSLTPLTPRNNVKQLSMEDLTLSQIKSEAQKVVQENRTASAFNLLASSRKLVETAQTLELQGSIRMAFANYYKAALLQSEVINSRDWEQETRNGGKGVLWHNTQEFRKKHGKALSEGLSNLEAKITQMDRLAGPTESIAAPDEATITKPGGSIADRMRALQGAGMSVSTNKRLSRELIQSPSSPTMKVADGLRQIGRSMAPPSSLDSDALFPSTQPPQSTPHFSMTFPSSPSTSTGLTISSTPTSKSGSPSPHAFVPTSTLGPPSPSSSPPNSPQQSSLDLSEFEQHFPTIAELDESFGGSDVFRLPSVPQSEPLFNLPSVPTNAIGAPSNLPPPPARPTELRLDDLPSPVASRPPSLPSVPVDPGPRPASTPIMARNPLPSRPPSPANGLPPSPTAPRKPLGLGLSFSPLAKPSPLAATPPAVSESDASLSVGKITNSVSPQQLHALLHSSDKRVVLLDIRTREEHNAERIKADATVCLEPSVLTRESVTGDTIEDSLVIAPEQESTVFKNRKIFHYLIMYDDASETLGTHSSPMSRLVSAIFEQEFKKTPKHPPVILVGGLRAWKQLYPNQVQSGNAVRKPENASSQPNGSPAFASQSISPLIPRSMNGGVASIPQSPPNGKSLTELTISGSRTSADPLEKMHSHSPSVAAARQLARKPVMSRQQSISAGPVPINRTLSENITGQHMPQPSVSQPHVPHSNLVHPQPIAPQPVLSRTTPIQYPPITQLGQSMTGSSFSSASNAYGVVSPPPQAVPNPSPLSRRRSDYLDQSQSGLPPFATRPSIDYPDLSAQPGLRPPPAAASPALERHDNRPRILPQSTSFSTSLTSGPRPPTIHSDYPVTYWGDVQIGTSGLKNLGNTCYMNSIIQCLSATVPFSRFFTDGRWKSAVNMVNPLGTKGNVAHAFASLLHEMWQGDLPHLTPFHFRKSICTYAAQFSGSNQHDSQEFLSFLMDGLHEDLNRILQKPPPENSSEREAELERLPQQIASEQEWKIYRMRNDSIIVDFFQGQFRNRMQCLTCQKTSTTYNAFMYLSLPIPTGRTVSKVTIQQCLDLFVKEEVMEKSDAWNCPHCKTLRRATKNLSLARLPPVLLIHLKRFSYKGPFTDKLETTVEFPLKDLDLTNYMPPPLPPGVDKRLVTERQPISLNDPRSQVPPYKYDLYGVTNHFGTLSSGHYTAWVGSRGGWLYCDDSRVAPADAKKVVDRSAYILYYKRTQG